MNNVVATNNNDGSTPVANNVCWLHEQYIGLNNIVANNNDGSTLDGQVLVLFSNSRPLSKVPLMPCIRPLLVPDLLILVND
jgi:hypothetical protein